VPDINLVKLPEMPKFLDYCVSPAAKEIGRTLSNIFYLIFNPINYPIEKLRIKQAENLKKYAHDIQVELNKIPEDKLVEPRLSIVGPALEASKYYIEEDEIRQMFAKLIASSMNTDTMSKVHHSIIEIIKQLSPLDASNLAIIFDKKVLPIAKFMLQKPNSGEGIDIKTHIFLSNQKISDIDVISASISNLIRLGLVEVDYLSSLVNDSFYDVFKEHQLAKLYNDPKTIEDLTKKSPYHEFKIIKGIRECKEFCVNG